jgi:hypothetical protein
METAHLAHSIEHIVLHIDHVAVSDQAERDDLVWPRRLRRRFGGHAGQQARRLRPSCLLPEFILTPAALGSRYDCQGLALAFSSYRRSRSSLASMTSASGPAPASAASLHQPRPGHGTGSVPHPRECGAED